MKILGITGGVGSGKSRILYDLEQNYGAYVIEADKLAHELMQPGMAIYNKIVERFGSEILNKAEPYCIDRERLGRIVFGNEDSLRALNSMIHPTVKEIIKERISNAEKSGERKLFVIEAALLIQDGYSDICDEIWYVWVERENRIRRLMAQRGYTREKCISIFDSQEPDEYYKKYAKFTINNNFDYENSSKQLKVRLNKFLSNDIID